MSKSPINFGSFAAISGGLAGNLANNMNRKAVGARVKKLENQVGVLMKVWYLIDLIQCIDR